MLASRFSNWVLTAITVSTLLEQVAADNVEQKTVLVKIGGSSITEKGKLEVLNEGAINWFASSIAAVISETFKEPAKEGGCRSSQGGEEEQSSPKENLAFVIVHGAGSFGHFSAKGYGLGVHSEDPPSNLTLSAEERRFTMRGIAETRLSVQTLNRLVVKTLLEHGVNAVGISPCFGIPGLEAHANRQNYQSAILHEVVKNTINAGLVPVLHGDACLFGQSGGILSGDTIMEMLGSTSWIHSSIFITDVDGVFTEDPRNNPKAELLRHILVDPVSGRMDINVTASSSSHKHDVTGGLSTKLQSAVAIAAAGTNVTIVKCKSRSAEQALAGEPVIEVASVIAARTH